MKMRYLFFIPMFFVVDCAAYFYHLEVLANGEQTVYLLRDCHGIPFGVTQLEFAEKKQTCDNQRIDLLNIAKNLQAHIIVEDALFGSSGWEFSSLASAGQELRNSFMANPLHFDPSSSYVQHVPFPQELAHDKGYTAVSPLFFLTQFCHQGGISVTNVESRFVDPGVLPNDIMFSLYCREIESIKAFADGFHIQQIYASALAQIVYLDQKTITKSKSPFYRSFFFDDHLGIFFELKMLHYIYNSAHANVFVCAGGDHIERVRQYLLQSGYKSIQEVGGADPRDGNPASIDIQVCLHNS